MARKAFGVVTKNGKFVSQDVLDRYGVKSADNPSKRIRPDEFESTYSVDKLIEPLYNMDQLARALELNTYHYRCCKVKARDTAGLGWDLVSSVENPSEAHKELISDFITGMDVPLSNMLDKVMNDFEALGNGAIEVVRDGYRSDANPVLLHHIPAHTMRVHKSGNKYCQIRRSTKRWFADINHDKDVHEDTGAEYEQGTLSSDKLATEIIWITNYTPRSDFYGIPDIIPALGAVHGDIGRRNYNISFFDNYGIPAYAVLITGNYEDEMEVIDGVETGRTELESAIEEHFNELAKNPHSTLIMSIPTQDREGEVEVEFKSLSIDVKEASFRLYRQDNRDEVLAAHGVPPYRAGVAETGSLGGSTAQESTEIYKRSIIEPRQEILENLINKHILWNSFEAHDWEFKFAGIDTSDEAHDSEILTSIFKMGGATPNEIIDYFQDRFKLDPSDHPAMSYHYINGQPVEANVDDAQSDDAQAVLMGLQKELIEIAKKDREE